MLYALCMSYKGVGGVVSCALVVWGFWGRLVCPASLVFYFVCCGDMGVPQVHPDWDLWCVFVEFWRGSSAEVVGDVGYCCVMCGVKMQRMAVHRLYRYVWEVCAHRY